MQSFARKIAVLLGAVAVSVGLVGATTMPAHAEGVGGGSVVMKDSSWPR